MKVFYPILLFAIIHKAHGVNHQSFIKTKRQWEQIQNEQNRIIQQYNQQKIFNSTVDFIYTI